jgi:hypothetical protein
LRFDLPRHSSAQLDWRSGAGTGFFYRDGLRL